MQHCGKILELVINIFLFKLSEVDPLEDWVEVICWENLNGSGFPKTASENGIIMNSIVQSYSTGFSSAKIYLII